MNLMTVGRSIHPGFEVPIWYNPCEDFNDLGVGTRLRLIFVQDGAGIIKIGENRIPLVAPCVLCLNETETANLEQSQSMKAAAIYFHPGFINSLFTFDNIRSSSINFSETDWQDRYWLRLFLIRDQIIPYGLLEIGLGIAERISKLFDRINKELEKQADCYWPCRSRSFFLELLFLLDRIYSNTVEDQKLNIPRTINSPNPMILYLYMNYKEEITISLLSDTFNMNRTSMCKSFKEATGFSIVDYLIQLRIRLACLLLRDTTIPVTEVTQRVGFKNLTHFGRTFSKYLGCSPSEYHKKYCWLLRG